MHFVLLQKFLVDREVELGSVSFLLQRGNKNWWLLDSQRHAGTGSQHGNNLMYHCAVKPAALLNYSTAVRGKCQQRCPQDQAITRMNQKGASGWIVEKLHAERLGRIRKRSRTWKEDIKQLDYVRPIIIMARSAQQKNKLDQN